ncbi:hypothetical protein FRC00_010678 [Tulasnella sp. 408]|nr:hypothetical protein FRC00_010678 [Tulasnella sp. 408]
MTTTPAGVPIVEERPSAAERLASLKLLKNAIVGNPKAKKAVVDEGAIYWMFDWLADIEYVGEDETLTWSVRVEAARVISTLANGCPYATLRLVRNRVLDALLLSITNLRPNRSKELDVALSTALKSVAASCSAIIGPLDSGLPEFYSHAERDEAKQVLERLFKVMIIPLIVFELIAYLVHALVAARVLTTFDVQAILVTDSIPILDTIHQTKSLTTLLKILVDGRPSRETSEWADEVPRAAVRLREAAFLTIAAATLHTQENRREVLNSPVSYIDMVIEGLNDEHVNIRYAACHAARAMSRSTEVQQTTAMDSGLAEKLWEALQKEKDSRVEVVILMCLTNLVVENSPFRDKMFQQGAIQYIVGMMDRPETSVQLNAIWTIRNTLWRANSDEHRRVFTYMGFDRFYRHAILLTSHDRQVRQQAIILARNTTTSLQMFEFIREGLGLQRLFDALAEGLDIDEDELALQAACTLDNIACLVDRRLFLDQDALLTVLKRRVKTRSGRARHAVFQLLKSIAGDELGAKGLRERGFDVAITEALRDADPMGMEADGGEWKITATQALKMLNR